jgi:glucose-6-phosphate 1-epimerase
MTLATAVLVRYRDQPCAELRLTTGDRVLVALHGGHLLSWTTADGKEQLYLSPHAVFDGHSAIRGGVPLCFPQFNERGPLPKHGFVRNLPWAILPDQGDAPEGAARLRLQISDNEATRAFWPQAFHLELTLTLSVGRLHMQVAVTNTGAAPWDFALALHTYLAVDAIEGTALDGLGGLRYWDSVGSPPRSLTHLQRAVPLQFDGEVDRVYQGLDGTQVLKLQHAGGSLVMTQSASFTELVVWNAGAHRCAAMSDMPADGYRHMLCVEAARVDAPITLAPSARWDGWQQLCCV